MHYREKQHLFTQSFFCLDVHLSSPVRQNNLVLSAWRYLSHTPSLFESWFYPDIHTMPFFTLPLSLSMLEYPVFHLAAHWAVCLASYVTSFLELLPPAHRHCISCQLLCASQWGSFFSGLLRHKYDPLMEMALSLVLKGSLPSPNTGEIVPPYSTTTHYIT